MKKSIAMLLAAAMLLLTACGGEPPAPSTQATEQPTEQPAKEVSLEEIKQVFLEKLAGHRDEIRAKIYELGAPSLSLIAPEKRSEMLEFLKGLD